MNRLTSILASILIGGAVQALAVLPGQAGENLDTIKAAGVIKIGTEGTYAPFTYHDPSGKLVVGEKYRPFVAPDLTT